MIGKGGLKPTIKTGNNSFKLTHNLPNLVNMLVKDSFNLAKITGKHGLKPTHRPPNRANMLGKVSLTLTNTIGKQWLYAEHEGCKIKSVLYNDLYVMKATWIGNPGQSLLHHVYQSCRTSNLNFLSLYIRVY